MGSLHRALVACALALVALPAAAAKNNIATARKAALAVLEGKSATPGYRIVNRPESIRLQVVHTSKRGDRVFAFAKLDRGLSRYADVYDVSKTGQVIEVTGNKLRLGGRPSVGENGQITYSMTLGKGLSRKTGVAVGQATYDPTSGLMTTAEQAPQVGPKGLAPGLELYQILNHYFASGVVSSVGTD